MLNKEQKQRAEQIRQEFAPLFDKGEKLAKIYQKESAKASALYRDWFAWSSVGESGHAADTLGKEEADRIATLRHTDPQTWHAETSRKFYEYENASERAKVAKINVLNYIAFIAEQLRATVSPLLDVFAPRGGLASLGEYLSRKNWAGQPLGVFFSTWCGSLQSVRITQTAGGIGADSGNAQSKNEPQALTVAKYRATFKQLKELKAKAEEIKTASRETVRAANLYGFAPFIVEIKESY